MNLVRGLLDVERVASKVQVIVRSGDHRIMIQMTPAEATAVIADLARHTAAIVNELAGGDRELVLIALNRERALRGLPALDSLP